ncbi:MAG: Rne/Rng family ribonuclease [Bacteroidetes bacterium]|nr:Rne/Rng family ribonuclease [Bacteroidota bacterium]
MKRNLIIQSSKQGLDIALLEDDKLVEFHQDVASKEYLVGDIYLGKIKKILPGLNAAFVDIGYSKNAFLHYHDLGPDIRNFNSFTNKVLRGGDQYPEISTFKKFQQISKGGEIGKALETDHLIMVQVIKEPISTKGHRISSQITLAGRYIVLIPFSEGVSVSKRIRDRKERKRLTDIFMEIKSPNFGVIVRTAAENKDGHLLEKDFNSIIVRWKEIMKNLSEKKTKLLGEYNKATSILRDMLNDSFDSIVVNDKTSFNELSEYLEKIFPEQRKILRFHGGSRDLFESYRIDRQIKSLFGKIINFGKGAYLVIEHTEAMTVIDVNSGSKANREGEREENVLSINIDAAEEIARQLRLRDIGGLIVVDFIDMRSYENQKILFEKMKVAMRKDKTQNACLPISKFGLMEITRQRVKPALELSITETCPVCRGSGEVKPTILVVDDIEHSLNFIHSELKVKQITIKVHPFISPFLRAGIIPQTIKWMFKYKMWIRIKASQALHLIDYKILDNKGKDLEEF